MVKKILTAIAIIMLVVGLGFLLFPPISNFIGKMIANSEADRFDSMIENIIDDGSSFQDAHNDGRVDDDGYIISEDGEKSDTPVLFKVDIDRLYKDSVAYNERLKEHQPEMLSEETYVNPSLDLYSYGVQDYIYGYVTADSIDMRLPIYLGANDSTMSYGAAHMSATSLPIGGDSTNTVLAGHTGYIGRIFFDNLRYLNIGDEVKIKNYWTELKYKVVRTEIHAPNESQDVFIEEGKDKLTMITCISDGNGGFDRYYVICEREK